ncbi:MAG: hypothetical protein JRN62_03275 [Nitrososphaerota archaeon]|jgi:hypothetical protein|nr:hypothetical protein [Nitrososphaerota archaeon]MDG6948619.1 hypothetical protein [Nitrososphaerota archaeon]
MSKPRERTIEGAIKSIVTSKESYTVLPNGTWTAGGCGIIADAMCRVWDYCDARLYVVRDLKTGVAHHIVTLIGRYYYDGNGKSTKKGLLKHWKFHENLGQPALEALQTWPDGIERDETASAFIAQMIHNYYSR